MRPRVIIVHKWGGNPASDWYPWLKKELEHSGFSVLIPAMPTPEKPEIATWVYHLGHIAKHVDQDTYLVGHSIGCQTILRFLEQIEDGKMVGGAVFVAPFLKLTDIGTNEDADISRPWLETPIDAKKVKERTQNIVAFFSDNDPFVPLENKDLFEKEFGARTIVERERGHFTAEDGVLELPDVADTILQLANPQP